MNKNKTRSLKRLMKRIDESPSPYASLLWIFLVTVYFLWAGASPLLPGSKGVEPLVPLIIFGLLAALYFFELPHQLSFLVSLSLWTIIPAPLILLLNIYRAWVGLLPAIWERSGLWRGPILFIGIQVLGLLLALGNFWYTVERWKNSAESERQEIKRRALLLLILMLILLAPLLFFVFAGLRGGG